MDGQAFPAPAAGGALDDRRMHPSAPLAPPQQQQGYAFMGLDGGLAPGAAVNAGSSQASSRLQHLTMPGTQLLGVPVAHALADAAGLGAEVFRLPTKAMVQTPPMKRARTSSSAGRQAIVGNGGGGRPNLSITPPNGGARVASGVGYFGGVQTTPPRQQQHPLANVTTPGSSGGGGGGRGRKGRGATDGDEDEEDEDADEDDADGMPGGKRKGKKEGGPASLSSKLIVRPPRLEEWRQKLFNVNELMVISHEDFETYWPHVDNVYSHRSTQEYKKQPIVSRYFDCRMKGRPPGTKKSDDPTKKKRQRAQRQLNQCDVKIKLTEYLEGSTLQYLVDEAARSRRKSGGRGADDGSASPSNSSSVGAVNAAIARGSGAHVPGLGLDGRRFWTVERVNGGGAKGGAATTPAGDERLGAGAPGAVDAGHKHDLAKSDEIKKNSVQRHEQDKERVMRKQMKHFSRRPTGEALDTYKKHQKARDLKLYGACYCPFSQRVWISLEIKKVQYQYIETDPYKRPTELLECNPKGKTPGLRDGQFAIGESAVMLEYLEEKFSNPEISLWPPDKETRATCRFWIKHIDNGLEPAFAMLLKEEDEVAQARYTKPLQEAIGLLVDAAAKQSAGPFFLGPSISLVDVHLAPFVVRMTEQTLGKLRGWTRPIPGTRWHTWTTALENHPAVRATTSDPQLYEETADIFIGEYPLQRGEAWSV